MCHTKSDPDLFLSIKESLKPVFDYKKTFRFVGVCCDLIHKGYLILKNGF